MRLRLLTQGCFDSCAQHLVITSLYLPSIDRDRRGTMSPVCCPWVVHTFLSIELLSAGHGIAGFLPGLESSQDRRDVREATVK